MFKKYKIVPEIVSSNKYYVVYVNSFFCLLPIYLFHETICRTLEEAQDAIKFLETKYE